MLRRLPTERTPPHERPSLPPHPRLQSPCAWWVAGSLVLRGLVRVGCVADAACCRRRRCGGRRRWRRCVGGGRAIVIRSGQGAAAGRERSCGGARRAVCRPLFFFLFCIFVFYFFAIRPVGRGAGPAARRGAVRALLPCRGRLFGAGETDGARGTRVRRQGPKSCKAGGGAVGARFSASRTRLRRAPSVPRFACGPPPYREGKPRSPLRRSLRHEHLVHRHPEPVSPAGCLVGLGRRRPAPRGSWRRRRPWRGRSRCGCRVHYSQPLVAETARVDQLLRQRVERARRHYRLHALPGSARAAPGRAPSARPRSC